MKKVIFTIIIIGGLITGYFLTQKPKVVKEEETAIAEPQNEDKNAKDKEEKQEEKKNEVRVINISAKKFQYSPNVINVKKGEKIKIVVEDGDVKHGIMVPELLFPPSQNNFNEIDLNIDKEGEYVFYCTNEICGSGHGLMRGKIIVS